MSRFVRLLNGSGAEGRDVGGKAAALDRLIGWGLPVPPCAAVTVAAYRRILREPELASAAADLSSHPPTGREGGEAEDRRVEEAFRNASLPAGLARQLVSVAERVAGGHRLAVRSSATAEDAPDLSFAGQYRSLLDVQPTDVPDAVRQVWASLWAPSPRSYRRAQGVDDDDVAMAVVLMRMVDAQVAGVLFTADPQGSPTDLRIELVEGLAEGLVAGRRTPRVVVVPRRGAASVPNDIARLVERLVRMGVDVEERFGAPQDIEWAASGDDVFLVQSRPITARRAPDDDGFDTPLESDRRYTTAGIAEMLPGTLPPLLWSLNGPMVNEAFRALSGGLGVPAPGRPVAVRVRGRAALDLDLLRSVATVTGGSAREVERQYAGEVLTADDDDSGGEAGARRVLAAAWRAGRLRHALRREAAAVQGAIDGVVALSVSVEELDGADLVAYRDQVHDLATRAVGAQVAVAVAAAASYRALELFLQRYVDVEEAPRRAQAITAGAVGAALTRPEASRSVFGGMTWDEERNQAMHARPDGPPSPATRAAAGRPGPDESLADLERELVSDPRWRLTRVLTGQLVDVRRRLLRRFAADALRFLALREDMKLSVLRLGGESRRATRQAARLLRETGAVEDEADVDLLTERELTRALVGRAGPTRRLAGRRRALTRAERAGELPRLFTGRPSTLIEEEVTEVPGEHRLEGWPAGAGRHRGRPRVVTELEEAQLDRDDVLVARTTDPSWTPLFLRAGALVVEEGGPLSHAAIVARELGIPAVVNARGATTHLVDVPSVTVDGDEGAVVIHDAAAGEGRKEAQS